MLMVLIAFGVRELANRLNSRPYSPAKHAGIGRAAGGQKRRL